MEQRLPPVASEQPQTEADSLRFPLKLFIKLAIIHFKYTGRHQPAKTLNAGKHQPDEVELNTMHQHTILAVDDEEMILKAIQRTLRKENYNVFTASGGEEGLMLLEAREVDVVISDQNMPDMNGIEFLQKVKANHPNTLTIMLTGQKEVNIAMEAINEAGVYKFILKPWDDEDFKLTIRRALESLDLMHERNILRERVKNRDLILRNLEKEHPGITQVDKDDDGYLILE